MECPPTFSHNGFTNAECTYSASLLYLDQSLTSSALPSSKSWLTSPTYTLALISQWSPPPMMRCSGNTLSKTVLYWAQEYLLWVM